MTVEQHQDRLGICVRICWPRPSRSVRGSAGDPGGVEHPQHAHPADPELGSDLQDREPADPIGLDQVARQVAWVTEPGEPAGCKWRGGRGRRSRAGWRAEGDGQGWCCDVAADRCRSARVQCVLTCAGVSPVALATVW